jgi:eukaryotic-like serine/threonine-protein kinase
VTGEGQVLGTLPYMSPEQVAGEAVDTRTDVYALGVVLYELIAGRPPFDVSGMSLPEASRALCESEPPRPSSIHRSLLGDIETIVLKALAKDRLRRYQSAASLAADIRHFLAGEAIDAKRDSGLYVLRKSVRRHRWAVAAALVLVCGLVAFSAYASVQAQRQARERATADWFAASLEKMLESTQPAVALGRDTRLIKEMMDAAAQRIDDGELSDAPEAELRMRLTIGGVYMDLAELEPAGRILGPAPGLAMRLHGRVSPEYARAISLHAWWLGQVQRRDEALKLREEALAIRRLLYRGDHPEVAQSLRSLGHTLRGHMRLDEERQRMEESLAMYRRLFPGDHEEVARTLNALAWSQRTQVDALPYLEESVAMRQRLYKGDHPDVAQGLRDLAYCLEAMGRSEESLERHEQSLAMRRRLHLGNHPDILDSYFGIAEAYESLLCFEDALEVSEQNRDMAIRLYGEDHVRVGSALANVATAQFLLGRWEEALVTYRQSLALRERGYSHKHYAISQSHAGIGMCLTALGRPAEALTHFEQAVAIRKAMGDTQAAAGYNCGLATALTGVGRFAEAETLLMQSWESFLREQVPTRRRIIREIFGAHILLYDAWHAAQPQAGHDRQADEWRAKLAAFEANPCGDPWN